MAAAPNAGSWTRALTEIAHLQCDRSERWLYALQYGLLLGLVWELYARILPCEMNKVEQGPSNLALALILSFCYIVTVWSLWPLGLTAVKLIKHRLGDSVLAERLEFLAFEQLQWFYEALCGLLLGECVTWLWTGVQTSLQCLRAKNCPTPWIAAAERLVDQIFTPFGLYAWAINLAWLLPPAVAYYASDFILAQVWRPYKDLVHAGQLPAPPAPAVPPQQQQPPDVPPPPPAPVQPNANPNPAAAAVGNVDLQLLNQLALMLQRQAHVVEQALDALLANCGN